MTITLILQIVQILVLLAVLGTVYYIYRKVRAGIMQDFHTIANNVKKAINILDHINKNRKSE